MRDYKTYKIVSIGNIPKSKLLKAIKTGKLSFTKDELKGSSHKLLVHPANHKLIMDSKKKNKGLTGMMLSAGEIKHDLELHKGGSLWDSIINGAKSVGKFVSDNYGIIKPVLSKLADVAIPALTTAFGAPELAIGARALTKSLTGVGIKERRIANLTKAREMKKKKKFELTKGGSFMIN